MTLPFRLLAVFRRWIKPWVRSSRHRARWTVAREHPTFRAIVASDGQHSALAPQAWLIIASRTALSVGGMVGSETIQSGRAVDGTLLHVESDGLE
jgi:hypothetical protein